MTPEMHDILQEVSLFYDPEPAVIFQKIVDLVGRYYNGSMTMINLGCGRKQVIHSVANAYPGMRGLRAFPLRKTFCMLAMQATRPLLIQNAAESPDLCSHPAVNYGYRRYLGVPVFSPLQEVIGTLCILDDRVEEPLCEQDIQFISLLAMRVSAELEREKIVQARIDEHRRTAESLSRLNAQLEANAVEKQRFVAMVIHDVRHPLTALRTLLYLHQKDPDPEQQAACIQAMEDRVASLSRLVDELLDYHQIESGRSPLMLETISVGRLAAECVEGFKPVFQARKIVCRCEIEEDLPPVQTDAIKLQHILTNLLSNALKFTTQGQVLVTIGISGKESWELIVEDTGSGIRPEEQERIFGEYYQTDRTQDGAGLGLSIVQQFCRALQGELRLESMPGKGACFRLRFPNRLRPDPQS